jgi:hypothetical protein
MTKEEQFQTFWKCYPRRIAKGTAKKAFDKAIRKTTLESMLEAITRYVAMKPEKIDFKHAATWLNGECWDDEWEPQQAKAPSFQSPSQKYQTREEYLRAEIARSERSFAR